MLRCLPCVDDLLGGIVDGEGARPLAVDRVYGVFLLACGRQRGGEGILFPREPAAAGVVDLGGEAAGGGDVRGLVQFDEGRAGPESFDVERREGDEVGFGGAGVGGCEGKDGVADLTYVDAAFGEGEGGFLAVVALELDLVGGVVDVVGGYRGVVTMLISYQPYTITNSRGGRRGQRHLTCSLTSSVLPTSSSQRPMNNSPKNGFNGFFSEPSFSLRELYCCFSVVKNHFSTRRARRAGSGSWVGATKTGGCSAQ